MVPIDLFHSVQDTGVIANHSLKHLHQYYILDLCIDCNILNEIMELVQLKGACEMIQLFTDCGLLQIDANFTKILEITVQDPVLESI